MDAKQLKAKLQGNAVIRASLEQGDIRLIYKRTPTLSDDLLFGTWTVEVLLVDSQFPQLITNALKGMGFEVQQAGDKLIAEFTFAITPPERRAIQEKAAAKREAAKDKKHADEIAALEARIEQMQASFTAQLDDLLEEVTVLGLLPEKTLRGEPGPKGKDGKDGRDGKDLDATSVELQDLADVSKIPPAQGQVLMWSELAQEWQPKRPASGITSISGGGGSGGGGVEPENPGPGGPGGDTNNGWLPKWWYETETGDWMPRTNAQNIGSIDTPVKEIFVSGGSIYFDEHVVDLQVRSSDVRLAYDGRILAYETYTDDGEPVEPFPDAPRDGFHYVRSDGEWIRLEDLLEQWGIADTVDGGLWSEIVCTGTFKTDAGNFETGQADGVNEAADGGNWNTGEIDDDWNQDLDGGNLN